MTCESMLLILLVLAQWELQLCGQIQTVSQARLFNLLIITTNQCTLSKMIMGRGVAPLCVQ